MTILKINESAIAHNVEAIRRHTSARVIAVVKEDGYGLGLSNEYAILRRCGVDFFAVATPWEALQLSNLPGEKEILLLTPESAPEALEELVRRRVIFMLNDGLHAAALRRAGLRTGCTPRVHLAVDTGLGRYGYAWNALETVPADLEGLQLEGCYTHFATHSRDYIKVVQRQEERFLQALAALRRMGIDPGLTHACASRAFAALGDLGCGAIRVGSLLLGRCAGPLAAEFEDAVHLEAPVFQTRLHRRGEVVGYDARCRLKRDTLVGLVRVGYADGAFLTGSDAQDPLLWKILRCVKAALRARPTAVRMGRQIVPVLGRIGMNHMLLDLTGLSGCEGEAVRIDVSPILVRRDIPRLMQ